MIQPNAKLDAVSADSPPPPPEVLEALRERFAPFKDAPTPVLLVDGQGRIVMNSVRVDQLFGYEPGELEGLAVEVLVPSGFRSRHEQLRAGFQQCPVNRQMGAGRDLYGESKDGRRIPVEIDLTSFDFEGERLVLAFMLDLTKRNKQDEKFRLVFDAAPSGMMMVDLEGRIALANSEIAQTFGYAAEELIGLSVEELMPRRFRPEHQVQRDNYAKAPERRQMGGGRDLFGRRKDGTEFPVEVSLTPLDTPEGRFIVSTVTDVTGLRMWQANELARLNQELTGFAYSLSHDLKTPLSSIQGLAEVVSEDMDAGAVAEAKTSLDRIRREAARLAALVEDVLAIVQADHMEEKWADTDVSGIVETVLFALVGPAKGTEIRLEQELRFGRRLMTEPSRFREVVEQLVSNSVKYSDPHKKDRLVRVRTELLSEGFRLSVRDNGLGIPEECHGELFQMFRRFHPEQATGSGLGLALVKKQVDRLGGEIEFESSPEGTEFRVTLPLEKRETPC